MNKYLRHDKIWCLGMVIPVIEADFYRMPSESGRIVFMVTSKVGSNRGASMALRFFPGYSPFQLVQRFGSNASSKVNRGQTIEEFWEFDLRSSRYENRYELDRLG